MLKTGMLVRLWIALGLILGLVALARAEAMVVQTCGALPQLYTAGGTRLETIDVNGVRCVSGAASVAGSGNAGYPAGATPITGNATGTTGAVVGTLAAAAGKFTYVCGFHVDAIGGTATVGPVTLAGIVGSSMVFQGSSTAAGNGAVPEQLFAPLCIPSSAVNTAITLTTTADGTATAVDVNMWGFQQ